MRKKYTELCDECSGYLKEYSSYSSSLRLSSIYSIFNVIDGISKSREFLVTDMRSVLALRDVCMRLDSALGLIYLDFSLSDNWYYNRDSLNILREDANFNLGELIRRSLLPYVTEGLEYQLQIGERLFMKSDDLGSRELSENSRVVFKDIIHGAMFLESNLEKCGIDANLLYEACRDFSSEQIGFVYAQLTKFDDYDSSFDEDAREELYSILRQRSVDEKKKFIKTICLLGYCNSTSGISAMMMDMYDICGSEGICHMMYEFMMDDGERKYGICNNYLHNILPQVHGAYLLRKKDISEGREVKSVDRYMHDSYNNLVKGKRM